MDSPTTATSSAVPALASNMPGYVVISDQVSRTRPALSWAA